MNGTRRHYAKWNNSGRENKIYYLTYMWTMGFLSSAVLKNPPTKAGDTRDLGLIPKSGRSPGVGNGNLRIPWTEELRGLQSMGSQRVRYN